MLFLLRTTTSNDVTTLSRPSSRQPAWQPAWEPVWQPARWQIEERGNLGDRQAAKLLAAPFSEAVVAQALRTGSVGLLLCEQTSTHRLLLLQDLDPVLDRLHDDRTLDPDLKGRSATRGPRREGLTSRLWPRRCVRSYACASVDPASASNARNAHEQNVMRTDGRGPAICV